MADDTDRSRRKLCRDMPLQKGEVFEVWLKDLIDAAGGEGDEDASWAQRFLGTDQRVGLRPAQQKVRIVANRRAVAALLAITPDKDLKAQLTIGTGRTER